MAEQTGICSVNMKNICHTCRLCGRPVIINKLHNNKCSVLHNDSTVPVLCVFHGPINSIYRAWPLRFRWTVCFNAIMEAHRGSSDHWDVLCITVGRGKWHYINKAELDRCTSMPSSIKFTALALMNGSRKTSSKNTFKSEFSDAHTWVSQVQVWLLHVYISTSPCCCDQGSAAVIDMLTSLMISVFFRMWSHTTTSCHLHKVEASPVNYMFHVKLFPRV